jgi:uracil-DNA glycosylase family 4
VGARAPYGGNRRESFYVLFWYTVAMPMTRLFSDYAALADVQAACANCVRCALSAGRRHVVFGAGSPQAAIMLVGQGPSLTDDITGAPYTGPAGEFLDTALAQAGLTRGDVWLTNLHKCVATKVDRERGREEMRPPRQEEVVACAPWLEEELLWIKPAVLVAIGGPAAEGLLGKEFQLREQRGQWQTGPHGIPTLATYQPTYLKRLSQWDRPAAVQGWRDLVADLRTARARAQGM